MQVILKLLKNTKERKLWKAWKKTEGKTKVGRHIPFISIQWHKLLNSFNKCILCKVSPIHTSGKFLTILLLYCMQEPCFASVNSLSFLSATIRNLQFIELSSFSLEVQKHLGALIPVFHYHSFHSKRLQHFIERSIAIALRKGNQGRKRWYEVP